MEMPANEKHKILLANSQPIALEADAFFTFRGYRIKRLKQVIFLFKEHHVIIR